MSQGGSSPPPLAGGAASHVCAVALLLSHTAQRLATYSVYDNYVHKHADKHKQVLGALTNANIKWFCYIDTTHLNMILYDYNYSLHLIISHMQIYAVV